MKLSYVLLLSLVIGYLPPTLAQKRFCVGLTAAPVLNHNRTNVTFTIPTGTGRLTDTTFEQRSTTGGFSVGLSAQYTLAPKWSLSTGVWFTQLRTTQPFPFTPGNVPSRVITSAYRIPLLLNYRLTTQRLSPILSVGTLAHLRGSTRYKSVAGSGVRDTEVKFGGPLSVQAVVGAGVTCWLTTRWWLTAQPLLIWRFPPKPSGFTRYDRYVIYQLQGQVQLCYLL